MRFLLRLPRVSTPFLRLMALSILIAAASGCIPIGVPLPPEGDPFTERKLDFIETGTTTKDEIEVTLSESPFELYPLQFHGGKVWVYHTDQKGWGGAGCVLAMNDEPTPCGVARGTKNHALLLRFDEQGIVDYWFEAEGDGAWISSLDIAAIAQFDLQFQEDGSGFLTNDGRTVEVVQVRNDKVWFKGGEEMLLAMKGHRRLSWQGIFFGEMTPARDAASEPLQEGSRYGIEASTLEELNAGMP